MNYYIGDMHLGHKNVIKFDGRPYSDVDEMDKALIDNWNRVVTDEDHVYIIGDFTYKNCKSSEEYVKQLKGHKHLIIGNHDYVTIKDENACRCFESMDKIAYIRDGDKAVMLCHFPIAEWNGKKRGTYHIYSHIHNRKDDTYEFMRLQPNALNAGCMINGYRPVTLEQLIENNLIYNNIN